MFVDLYLIAAAKVVFVMDLSFLGHESCSTIPHSHGNHPETTGMVSVSSLFMLFLTIQDKTSLPRGLVSQLSEPHF